MLYIKSLLIPTNTACEIGATILGGLRLREWEGVSRAPQAASEPLEPALLHPRLKMAAPSPCSLKVKTEGRASPVGIKTEQRPLKGRKSGECM